MFDFVPTRQEPSSAKTVSSLLFVFIATSFTLTFSPNLFYLFANCFLFTYFGWRDCPSFFLLFFPGTSEFLYIQHCRLNLPKLSQFYIFRFRNCFENIYCIAVPRPSARVGLHTAECRFFGTTESPPFSKKRVLTFPKFSNFTKKFCCFQNFYLFTKKFFQNFHISSFFKILLLLWGVEKPLHFTLNIEYICSIL